MTQPHLTADELLLARAEANGYQRGAHRQADEVRGREKHVKKTKTNQDGTLRRYILWHLGAARKEAGQKGLTPPDEEAVRQAHLHTNAPAPDLATVKDFLRFYIATSRPRLDAERPTADSVNIVAEWFFAGFTRITGTATDEEERSEVYNWVRRTLTLEGIVVNKHRPKHNFSERDLSRLILTLWTRDDLVFIPERYRVQVTFIIHVYCWTGARIGAFFTGGLRYKDVTLVLQRTGPHDWRLIYKLDQRWVKNNRDPEEVVFGAAAKESERLFYNDAGFLLAMAFADKALFGYDSLEDLRQQEIPPGEDELILRFDDNALDRPILRHCTKSGGTTDAPMSRSAFDNIFRSTLTNAGYVSGPSIHAIRRQLGKKVDARYTAVERSQHLLQADPRVFGQSYVANCSSVDGQAAFRGEISDHRHIEYFQSLEKFHEEGLPDRLPAHLEQEILRDPELCALDREARGRQPALGRPQKSSSARQSYTNRLRTLKRVALRQYQQNWVRERRDWKILTRGKELPPCTSKTDFVQSVSLLIPERGRLAEQMSLERQLTPDEMWQALEDLRCLCVQDFTVLFLPQSRPVDGACPVKCCLTQLDSLPKADRNQHIQCCVRWDMAHRLCRLQSEVHYCYLCYEWVVGEEWDPHCQMHLDNLTSKRCGTITSCHTLVRPGYCPFCIVDPQLRAFQRLESWTRDRKLWTHIRDKHSTGCVWPRRCPHPLCETQIKDFASFQFHLVDEHGLVKPSAKVGQCEVDSCDTIYPDNEVHSRRQSSQKRKKPAPSSLEWVPHKTIRDIKACSAGTSSDIVSKPPSKRPKHNTDSVCPSILSLDNVGGDSWPGDDSLSIQSPSPFRYDDGDTDLEAGNAEPVALAKANTILLDDVVNPGDSAEFDSLFDLYLRSPSPSPAPANARLEATSPRPVARSEDSKPAASSPDAGRESHDQSATSNGAVPRIRLRVRQPAITLCLKAPKLTGKGKAPPNKGERRPATRRARCKSGDGPARQRRGKSRRK